MVATKVSGQTGPGPNARGASRQLFGLVFLGNGWMGALVSAPSDTLEDIDCPACRSPLDWRIYSALRRVRRSTLTSHQKARGKDVIQLNDQWVERTSSTLSIRQEWSGIERITETQRVFWLWDKSRPVFSIEKSAVPDETQLRSLRQLLRQKKPGHFFQDADGG